MYTVDEISGARIGNIFDSDACRIAYDLYEQFRNRDDIDNVARNTQKYGFNYEQIQLIKDYIFYEVHLNRKGELVRFTPSYDMAESWRRLSEHKGKHIKPHDIIMLQHEALEIAIFLTTPNCTQMQAHARAEQTHNYKQASDAYYLSLGIGVN